MKNITFVKADSIALKPGPDKAIALYFMQDGESTRITPKRLFPLTKPYAYIRLLDPDNRELGILKNTSLLPRQAREFIEHRLDQYYFIPRITDIHDIREKYGISHWVVTTDRGRREFDVRSRSTDIKVFNKKRILIKDADENTYEIPDEEQLPPHSRLFLQGEI